MQGTGQRGITRPSEVGGTSGGEESGYGDERTEEVQPVAECVQSRERHIRCADLQGKYVVREAEDDRSGIEQQHDRAVHGEELVVLLVREKLKTGDGKFGPDQQGHQSAQHEEGERGDQIHHAQLFGIGRSGSGIEERALEPPPFRVRPRRKELCHNGSHGRSSLRGRWRSDIRTIRVRVPAYQFRIDTYATEIHGSSR